nr:protein phosphatase 2C domain-containing protein [uncultured Cohaesibacter sp.]
MQVSWFSNSGSQGGENSDCVYAVGSVVSIADGMGGLSDSASAARFAAEQSAKQINERIENGSFCEKTIHDTFGAINASLLQKLPGAGTTLAILALFDDHIWCASVGDTKIFAFLGTQSMQVSIDENLSEQTGLKVHQKILTNYLGKEDAKPPRISKFSAKSGSVFVLCTDGVSEVLDILEFGSSCNELRQEEVCRLLSTQAQEQEPKDDYSAVVISVQ